MSSVRPQSTSASDRPLIFLLAAITSIAPLVMQIYLPALPGIGRDLEASSRAVQLTFSAFVFTVGPAQLVYGPLADRFGRRATAIASLIICLVGTLACALAPSIGALVVARIVQAFGSAGGMVVTRAVLSDRYGSEGMAARLSSVIVVIVVVPMIAPLFGGYFTDWYGWRSVFAASGVMIAVVTTIAFAKLPETRKQVKDPEPFIAGTLSLLKKPLFLVYSLQSALSLSVFYTFISVVPYVMENTLGEPPTTYGKYFILLSGGYMFGTFLSSRLASEIGMLNMIRIGTTLALVGALVMVVSVSTGTLSPERMFLPMVVLAFANGLSSPSLQSAAVLQSKNYAGTASGIVGCSQQLIAGIATQVVALWGLVSPQPMAVFIVGASMAMFSATLLLPVLIRRAMTPTTD
ncbi:MAG: multidrug effflux MFS transporter [Pseudomonadota bacterium]